MSEKKRKKTKNEKAKKKVPKAICKQTQKLPASIDLNFINFFSISINVQRQQQKFSLIHQIDLVGQFVDNVSRQKKKAPPNSGH